MQRPELTPFGQKSRRPPRNYFSRREQYRLLVMAGVLCGVLWAMNEARDPKNWEWFVRLDGGAAEATSEEELADPPGGYDTRLIEASGSDRALSPDVFEIPQQGPPPVTQLEGEFFPGVRADYVQSVVDDRPISRGSEYHAFYHFLDILQRTPLAELEAASEGEVGFRQLFEQTEEYRGQLVTVNAIVHSVSVDQASPENEYGIGEFYRVYMEPVGGPRELITAIFLDLPESFPVGEAVADEQPQIEFTGFFYKREPYQSNDPANNGMRTAPLLLAKTPHWIPPAPRPEPVKFDPLTFALSVAGTGLLAVVLACGAWFFSQRRSPEAARYALTSRVQGKDIASPNDEDVLPSPGESLARLAKAETQAGGEES